MNYKSAVGGKLQESFVSFSWTAYFWCLCEIKRAKMEENQLSTYLSNIQRLKGQDTFDLWKFQVTVFLQAQNVFGIATGVTEQPKGDEEKMTDWIKKDAMCKKIFIMTIDRALQTHIMHCATAQDMWKKMIEIFENKGEETSCVLMQEFFDAKYEKGESIMNHVSKLENIYYKLKASDSSVTDNMLIHKILSTLPDTMNAFKTVWEMAPKEDKKLSNLISRLLIEEKRMKPSTEGDQVNFLANKKVTLLQMQKGWSCKS